MFGEWFFAALFGSVETLCAHKWLSTFVLLFPLGSDWNEVLHFFAIYLFICCCLLAIFYGIRAKDVPLRGEKKERTSKSNKWLYDGRCFSYFAIFIASCYLFNSFNLYLFCALFRRRNSPFDELAHLFCFGACWLISCTWNYRASMRACVFDRSNCKISTRQCWQCASQMVTLSASYWCYKVESQVTPGDQHKDNAQQNLLAICMRNERSQQCIK